MQSVRSRIALQLEILALRHQLGVLQRSVKRPKLTTTDRFLWAWLCCVWPEWRSALVIVKPDTVISWQRKAFRLRLNGLAVDRESLAFPCWDGSSINRTPSSGLVQARSLRKTRR